MSNAYIGEIRLFPYTYAPRDWAYCDGQTLPIKGNETLYSIIGTTYGGNGTTNFALPNLKGKIPLGAGHGPGLENYPQGHTGGEQQVTLTLSNLPVHSHTMKVSTGEADESAMNNLNIPGQLVQGAGKRRSILAAYAADEPTQPMHENTLGPAGENAAHYNEQPYLVVPYCICMDGVYPQRS